MPTARLHRAGSHARAQRFSAAGRTSSGFIKRDGRQRESETLVARLVDRPLRPMFADGFYAETQVLQLVLSWGGTRPADALAITAAGAAAFVSDLPFAKPVAGVRVGWPRGSAAPVVNPTLAQMADSRLDLVVAGTHEALLMIEGFADFLSDEEMLQAVAAGQAGVAVACDAIAAWALLCGKPKDASHLSLPPPGLDEALQALAGARLEAGMRTAGKKNRARALTLVDALVADALTEQYGAQHVAVALKAAHSRAMRGLLRREGVRSDGRGLADVRPITCAAGLLPPVVHGSALFTRGETQVLAVATLGGDADAQREETLAQPESLRRFALHYFFPPSSVGETGRTGAPTRRELGHGTLAERALAAALPPPDAFPYALRLEATVTESNGSSSMASVCAGWLALRDAGVPLTRPVAGVAMGLLLPEAPGQAPLVLTDILGSEDALGDMDFKVAGCEQGVTAFQMDIKVEGITQAILRDALAAARVGRAHILGRMGACAPPPRGALSAATPRVGRLTIDPAKAGALIGAGGKNVRAICDATGATDIQITDGTVSITAPSQAALDAALAAVRGAVTDVVVGTVFRGARVTALLEFGALVEMLPGKVGLCHISELSVQRVETVAAVVKEGDLVDVKLIEVTPKARWSWAAGSKGGVGMGYSPCC